MADIEMMMMMFQPLASDMGQLQSSCPVQQSAEDSSFVECLLGAFNGAGRVIGNETSPDDGKPLLISCVSKGVEWKFKEDLLGFPQRERSMIQSPGPVDQKDRITEIKGTLPAEGNDTKKIESVGKLIKGSGDANSDAFHSIPKAKGVEVGTKNPVASSEAADKAIAGEIRKETESPPEILRIAKDSASVSSEPVLQKVQKSLLTDVPAASRPDVQRVVRGEVLGQLFQDLVRRSNTSHVSTQVGKEGKGVLLSDTSLSEIGQKREINLQVGKEGRGVLLSDPSVPEIGQKREMREFVPIYEEAASSRTTQPLSPGETLIVRNRPISLADGVMPQILENLNLRTWKVGQKELKIQLHPEELGRLRMEIGLKDHQVVLKINVENPFVKDLIENNLAQLREGLLDRGLRMDKCSVTVSDHFQHQSGRNQDNSTGSGDHPFSMDRGEAEETASQRVCSPYHQDSDLVNLFI